MSEIKQITTIEAQAADAIGREVYRLARGLWVAADAECLAAMEAGDLEAEKLARAKIDAARIVTRAVEKGWAAIQDEFVYIAAMPN